MATQVDICNFALSAIGQRVINEITDPNENARKCALFFDRARDSTLRSHSWGFATKIAALVEMANEEVPGWEMIYAYPANCLYVQKIFLLSDTDETPAHEFEIINSPDTNVKSIVARTEAAHIRYTAQITDTESFDDAFIDALTYRLAAMIAQPLTGDSSLATQMTNMHQMMLDTARRVNQSERYKRQNSVSSYVDSR